MLEGETPAENALLPQWPRFAGARLIADSSVADRCYVTPDCIYNASHQGDRVTLC
jgi:hypothetical protein